MNRNLLILVAGVAVTAAIILGALAWRHVAGPGSSGPAIVARDPDPAVAYRSIEAESPLRPPSGAMVIVAANDSSGHKAMAVPAETEKEGGQADYTVPNLEKGSYRLWIRAFWQDGCGNSVGCTVGDRQIVFTDGIFDKWHWLTIPKAVSHAGGNFSFSLVRREDGIMVDQVLMTSDPHFIPHGIMAPGAAEARRSP